MRKIKLTLIVTISILCLSACGNKTEFSIIDVPQILYDDIITDSTETESVSEKLKDASTDPYVEAYIEETLISAGKLWFMTDAEFEVWCAEHYPSITDHVNMTWEEMDWGLAKNLLYKVTFGTTHPQWADDIKIAEEFGVKPELTEEELEQAMFDEYAPDFSSEQVFYMPPKGFIAAMSTEEKRNYIEKVIYRLYEEEYAKEALKMLSVLTDEEIEQMAQEIADAVEISYPNYTYKAGDEDRQKTKKE